VVHVNNIVVIIFIDIYLWKYSTGLKWTGYKFDHSPLTSGEGKNEWHSTCSQADAFMAQRYLVANHIQGKFFQSFERTY